MSRHTPGVAGYVVAVVVSVAVTAFLIALSALGSEPVWHLPAVFVVACVYVSIFALPTAPVGVLLVHLTCRHVRAQWVHVLAAGVAGLLTGVAFGLWVDVATGIIETWSLTLSLGVATATGRAAVIPLVPGERGRRAPVDDDFARTPPGW